MIDGGHSGACQIEAGGSRLSRACSFDKPWQTGDQEEDPEAYSRRACVGSEACRGDLLGVGGAGLQAPRAIQPDHRHPRRSRYPQRALEHSDKPGLGSCPQPW